MCECMCLICMCVVCDFIKMAAVSHVFVEEDILNHQICGT